MADSNKIDLCYHCPTPRRCGNWGCQGEVRPAFRKVSAIASLVAIALLVTGCPTSGTTDSAPSSSDIEELDKAEPVDFSEG